MRKGLRHFCSLPLELGNILAVDHPLVLTCPRYQVRVDECEARLRSPPGDGLKEDAFVTSEARPGEDREQIISHVFPSHFATVVGQGVRQLVQDEWVNFRAQATACECLQKL